MLGVVLVITENLEQITVLRLGCIIKISFYNECVNIYTFYVHVSRT